MNYHNDLYANEEIAKLVSYSIATDCEKGRHRFEEEFNKEPPPVRTVREWKKRFLETLSVLPRPRNHPQERDDKIEDQTKENLVTAMGDGTCKSQRAASRQFGIGLSSVNRILKERKMTAYKYTMVQELKETDLPKRIIFCEKVANFIRQDQNWFKRIIFSDEATLNLNGSINTHNSYYYARNNEHRVMEKSLKSPSITIWAMIPFDGRVKFKILNQTMNGARYEETLREEVIPTLQLNRYKHHYYQQDGASVHWTIVARHLLDDNLPGRWIGRSGPIEWPARSPDLSVNDFWLWGYLRDNVFQEPRAENLQVLSERCQHFFNNIDFDMVKNAFSSFEKRCFLCLQHNGAHFEQYL